MKEKERVPIAQKLNLTVDEAVEYSNIGEHKIRSLLKEPDCDFRLMKGTNVLIKRKKFEEYISKLEVI